MEEDKRETEEQVIEKDFDDIKAEKSEKRGKEDAYTRLQER